MVINAHESEVAHLRRPDLCSSPNCKIGPSRISGAAAITARLWCLHSNGPDATVPTGIALSAFGSDIPNHVVGRRR